MDDKELEKLVLDLGEIGMHGQVYLLVDCNIIVNYRLDGSAVYDDSLDGNIKSIYVINTTEEHKNGSEQTNHAIKRFLNKNYTKLEGNENSKRFDSIMANNRSSLLFAIGELEKAEKNYCGLSAMKNTFARDIRSRYNLARDKELQDKLNNSLGDRSEAKFYIDIETRTSLELKPGVVLNSIREEITIPRKFKMYEESTLANILNKDV